MLRMGHGGKKTVRRHVTTEYEQLEQVAQVLQQRIGQLVSQYETQLALMAARLQVAEAAATEDVTAEVDDATD